MNYNFILIYTILSYNMDSYAPAYVEFRDKISVVHFIGKQKPWHYQRFADGTIFQHDNKSDHVQLWWNTWDNHYDKV